MENADQLPLPSKINIPKLLNPNFLVENVFIFSVLVLFLSMYGPRLHHSTYKDHYTSLISLTIKNKLNKYF